MADSKLLVLTEDNFDDEVTRGDGPLLVDFWAAWCAPCQIVGPTVEQLAGELVGRARVGKVDVDENGDLANRFGITSIPTLMVFKDGRVVDQMIGAHPKDHIRRMLEKHL